MSKHFKIAILFMLVFSLLTACNTELKATGEALAIKDTVLPDANINEEYSANILVVGGLTPYHFELTKGKLPEGFSLQGGTIRGLATAEGQYSFTISVSDANLSKTFKEYNLSVVVPPPAELTLNIPQTEIQRTITVRAEIKEARELQGFRTNISWDSELFEYVPDSLKTGNDSFAMFFEQQKSSLEVDIAVLGRSLSGKRRVFTFELRPIDKSFLEINFDTEFLSSSGNHAYSSKTEGKSPDYNTDNGDQ